MISRRLARRFVQHHLPIGGVSVIAGYVLYATKPVPDVLMRLSFSSAYPALILICATLFIGPFKLLLGERLPASMDLRRDIGIWAGIVGLFHTVVGQCVHLRGRPWLYYIYENWQQKHVFPVRHDLFGLANYTGLIAALILLALLATSNDSSLRILSTVGWKRLQRWNYAIFGLTAVHTFTYQVGIEKPLPLFVATAAGAIAIGSVLQWIGYRRKRLLR